MASPQFVFVQHHGAKDPRKQHALEVMEVKAHAARMLHRKRKQRQQRSCPICRCFLPAGLSCQPGSSRHPPFACQLSRSDFGVIHFCHSPQTPLGQGRLDPFDSGQSQELPAIMQQGLDYVYEVLWPMNSPALQGPLLKSTINAWRTAGVQSDLEYHAQISNAASLCMASSTDTALQRALIPIRLAHQNKAIHLIREAI